MNKSDVVGTRREQYDTDVSVHLCRAKSSRNWRAIRQFIAQNDRYILGTSAVWIVDQLITDRTSVIVVRRNDRILAVSSVLDTCATASNCAELVVLAMAPGENSTKLLQSMLKKAERLAMASPRKGLEVALPGDLSSAATEMRDRGYEAAYIIFDLERTSSAITSVDLGNFTIRSLVPEDISNYYRVVLTSFEGIAGVSIPDFETFRTTNLLRDPPPLLILDEGIIAGFVRISCGENGIGNIEILGRHPDYRATGLGTKLLRAAIERLGHMGARKIVLQVSTDSEQALKLYQREGFDLRDKTEIVTKIFDKTKTVTGSLVRGSTSSP